jgi:transposase
MTQGRAKKEKRMTEEAVCVGVDVAKGTLDLAVSNSTETRQFENNHEGITSAASYIAGLKPSIIILEATGHFEMPLAAVLQTNHLPVVIAFNLRVAPNCWSTGPAMAATIHVSFSEPDAFIIETPVDVPEAPIVVTSISPPEKGYWKLPESPGLGIEFDEKQLQKYIIK